jgi:hypothetical protein
MSSSPTEALPQATTFEAVNADQFRNEILPRARPALLRGVACNWPLVRAGLDDPYASMAMLARHANGVELEVLRLNPEHHGRFHYSSDGMSLNFVRGRGNIAGLLAGLRDQESLERPYALVAQGLIAERYLPGFARAHPMPLVPPSAEPRLWIGNAAKIATHNDPVENLAVVAAGRRRFTLFPPECEANLYMGPKHPTPAGTPISMVHVTMPDTKRFPRFAAALECAQEAELCPGDALFIPRDWFHHVEALEKFNVLVNYWWDSEHEKQL